MENVDIHHVLKLLPHRYPFLLIDRVLECDPGKKITALKNVTINEPFFQGHFPERPVMPGVLILEALAQATGIVAFTAQQGTSENALYYLVGIDHARFKRPVEPGDQLILHAEMVRRLRDIGKFKAEALVDDEVVASAEIMCAERRTKS